MTRKSFFTTALSLLGFAALAPRAKAEPATAGSVPNTNPTTRNPQPAEVPTWSTEELDELRRSVPPVLAKQEFDAEFLEDVAEVPMELRSPQRNWHIAPNPKDFSAVIAWVLSVASSVTDGELPLDEAIAGVFGFGHTLSKALQDAFSNAGQSTQQAFLSKCLYQNDTTLSGMALQVFVQSTGQGSHGGQRAIANGLCEALRMGMVADPFYPDFLPELGIKPSIVAGVPLRSSQPAEVETAPSYLKCPQCDGLGEVNAPFGEPNDSGYRCVTAVKCGVCQGKGLVSHEYMEAVSRCVRCPDCVGVGRTNIEFYGGPDPLGRRLMRADECRTCRGTGRVNRAEPFTFLSWSA